MYKRDLLKTTSKVIARATLAPGALAGDPPIPRPKGAWTQRQLALQQTKSAAKARTTATDLACLLDRLGSHSRANRRKDAVARPRVRF